MHYVQLATRCAHRILLELGYLLDLSGTGFSLRLVKIKLVLPLFFLLFSALESSDVVESPKISWLPKRVVESVVPNGQLTERVTFTANNDLGDIQVSVVPELQPYALSDRKGT